MVFPLFDRPETGMIVTNHPDQGLQDTASISKQPESFSSTSADRLRNPFPEKQRFQVVVVKGPE
jgi:hypothetical protein